MEMRDLALREKFGARLRELRTGAGLTQRDLADLAEMNVKYLSELERGRSSPTMEVMVSLAQGLGVKPGELFPGEERPEVEARVKAEWLAEYKGITLEQMVQELMKSFPRKK